MEILPCTMWAVRMPDYFRTLPRGVWALGFVSFFMDTSLEMIHSLLPLLLVGAFSVGITELARR